MTISEPQLTGKQPADIAVVCFPGAQATSIHGLTDLFSYADHFGRMHFASAEPLLRVSHWEPNNRGEVACRFESYPGVGRRPAVVIVPAFQIAPPAPGLSPECAKWVRERHAEGSIVAAVCGGVFLLAEAGLLDGRRATTHWMFAAELQRRFPSIAVESDLLVLDDHDLITAGGVLAWADMGLMLVERLLGGTVMNTTAHFILMDPRGREQRLYGNFAPRLHHGDKAILGVQQWLQANLAAPCSVRELAERAGLGSRTFLRRFTAATGHKPSDYQQRLRIARGRERLEFTRDTVEQIAVATGYEDAGGFRRVFKRVIGVSPAEYRKRFQRLPAG